MEGVSRNLASTSEPVLLLDNCYIRQSDLDTAIQRAHALRSMQLRSLFAPGKNIVINSGTTIELEKNTFFL